MKNERSSSHKALRRCALVSGLVIVFTIIGYTIQYFVGYRSLEYVLTYGSSTIIAAIVGPAIVYTAIRLYPK